MKYWKPGASEGIQIGWFYREKRNCSNRRLCFEIVSKHSHIPLILFQNKPGFEIICFEMTDWYSWSLVVPVYSVSRYNWRRWRWTRWKICGDQLIISSQGLVLSIWIRYICQYAGNETRPTNLLQSSMMRMQPRYDVIFIKKSYKFKRFFRLTSL